MNMLNRGDPSVAFKQEQMIQKLHSDVPELRELLRWARRHVSRGADDCDDFLERARNVLGVEFANSGDGQLAPKAVRKKKLEKRGQANASNNAGTEKLDGGQPRGRQPSPNPGPADPNLRRPTAR